MANDFSKLTAGFDALAAAITAVIADLQNPEVDNNDQEVIDLLSSKLDGAVSALTSADAAFKAASAPTTQGTITASTPGDVAGGVIAGTTADEPADNTAQ